MKTEKEIIKEIEDCSKALEITQRKLNELIMTGNLNQEYRKAKYWFSFYNIRLGTLQWVLESQKDTYNRLKLPRGIYPDLSENKHE